MKNCLMIMVLAAFCVALSAQQQPLADPMPMAPEAAGEAVDQPVEAETAPEVSDAEVDALIDKLENEDEDERDQALVKLEELGEAALPRILEYGLKTKYHPAIVMRLTRVLGSIHAKGSVEALKNLLKSPIAEIRVAAIQAIERLGDEKLIFEIMPLASSEHEMVRRQALLVLGKYGFKSSVSGLVELLKDTYPHNRIKALVELRKYPEMKDMIVDAVVPLLETDDPQVALEAAATLQGFNDPRGEAFFGKILSEKSSLFQEKAIEYAGRYRIASAVPFLMKTLKDDNWYRRYIAVDALGSIKDTMAIPSLKLLFEGEEVVPVRVAIARVFYNFKHPDLMEVLQNKITIERNVDVRWFIVATIGAIGAEGAESALYPLIIALMDSEEKIRIEAISALRQITEQNFGYDPRGTNKERAPKVKAWEQWLRSKNK